VLEIAVANMESYKSPGNDQIPAALIQQEVKYYCHRSTNSFILFGINKYLLISVSGLIVYRFTKRTENWLWNITFINFLTKVRNNNHQ
jgi:hypothetical protein